MAHLFDKRCELIAILKSEDNFRIQIYSLEAVEVFERFLAENKIDYDKRFTTDFVSSDKILLLLDDGCLQNTSPKMILYSNARRHGFAPVKFRLSEEEKLRVAENKTAVATSKWCSLTSVATRRPDIHQYTANVLSHIQCVILMCMTKASKFQNIAKEAASVDPDLSNRLIIKCELNALVNMGICSRTKNTYKISVSSQTVARACEKIGFKNMLNQ